MFIYIKKQGFFFHKRAEKNSGPSAKKGQNPKVVRFLIVQNTSCILYFCLLKKKTEVFNFFHEKNMLFLYKKNPPLLRNRKIGFLKKSVQKNSFEVLPDLLNDPLVGLKACFF